MDPGPPQREVRRRFPPHAVLLEKLWRHAWPADLQWPVHGRDDGRHAARLGEQLAAPVGRERPVPPGVELLRVRAGRLQDYAEPDAEPRAALRADEAAAREVQLARDVHPGIRQGGD